jgi:hypothetical protein
MALLPYIAEAENLFETSGKCTIYFTKKKERNKQDTREKVATFFIS